MRNLASDEHDPIGSDCAAPPPVLGDTARTMRVCGGELDSDKLSRRVELRHLVAHHEFVTTTVRLCLRGGGRIVSKEARGLEPSPIWSMAFSPDGTKIVSGSDSGTITVRRNAGAFQPPNHPCFARMQVRFSPQITLASPKYDACWLAWQLRWILRLRRLAQTASVFILCSTRPMGQRLFLEAAQGRSRYGTEVRLRP